MYVMVITIEFKCFNDFSSCLIYSLFFTVLYDVYMYSAILVIFITSIVTS